jgi:hypothetical protein
MTTEVLKRRSGSTRVMVDEPRMEACGPILQRGASESTLDRVLTSQGSSLGLSLEQVVTPSETFSYVSWQRRRTTPH